MRPFRLAAAAALLCTVSACGGADGPEVPVAPDGPAAVSPAAPAPAPPSEAAGDDASAVENAFLEYNQALAEQDAATACALTAPETVEMLVSAVSEQLGQEVAGCDEAFGLVFSTPGAGELARRTASTIEVQEVAVDGDTAAVTWSADMPQERPTVTNDMRRVDGRWLIVGTG